MTASAKPLDVLLLVPFQPLSAQGMDPVLRRTLGGYFGAPLARAMAEFEAVLGRPLNFARWPDHPLLGDSSGLLHWHSARSLTALVLANHLERQGLRWAAVDPGAQDLKYWRRLLTDFRPQRPRVVALSTTFVISGVWLRALTALIRRILPDSAILIGGTFYVTSMRQFLGLDGDAYCLGEGEHRLPRIVATIRDGESLTGIGGLWLRGGDGEMRYTGPVEPLPLAELPPVDWALADRIIPPAQFDAKPSYYYLETQRGCAFRCEFCTYATLAHRETLDPSHAVEEFWRTAALPPGYLMLVDSTATFPHQRWQELMRRLGERGGSPHPLLAFARVSDINDTTAALMARAGVHEVYIGQESGDQRMLDAMRKAIRVEHVPVAIAALGKHGIGAQFSFIHGFPGETPDSLANTRAMIASLNQGFEDRPVAYAYAITPFLAMETSSINLRQQLQQAGHPLAYEAQGWTATRAGQEALLTMIATSRVPHAPVCSILFEGQGHFLFTLGKGPRRYQLFRWLKAVERGIMLHLEQILTGAPPNPRELRAIRESVLAGCESGSWLLVKLRRLAARARARLYHRIQDEWTAEETQGPGRLTRLFLAASVYRDFGSWRQARAAQTLGTYPVDSKPVPV